MKHIVSILALIFLFTTPVLASDIATDRAALIALYNATYGDNWTDNTNWNTDATIGNWYGVTVNDVGRVTELNLYDNGLNGTIPTEIGNLTALTLLNLSFNRTSLPITGPATTASCNQSHGLRGAIPSSLGDLTQLQSLSLTANCHTGTIPSSLGDLTQLTWLGLAWNNLSGSIPDTFSNLRQLQGFVVSRNFLTGDFPSWIGDLTELTQLTMDSNFLTGSMPDGIGNLTKLKMLRLNANQMHGPLPSTVGNLTAMEYFLIPHNNFSGSLRPEFGQLSNLKSLGLSFNDFAGEIPWEAWGPLQNINAEIFVVQHDDAYQYTGCIPGDWRTWSERPNDSFIPDDDFHALNLPTCIPPTNTPWPTTAPGPAHREIGNFGLSATGMDLKASWSQPEERPLDYHVAWARADEHYEAIGSPSGHGYPTDRQYSITGLESGVTYKVRVRAQYADAYGPWRAEMTFLYWDVTMFTEVAATNEAVLSLTATSEAVASPTATETLAPTSESSGVELSPPENLRLHVQADGIRLTWDEVEGADGYAIMRHQQPLTEVAELWTVAGGEAMEYLDSAAREAGQTYTYAVAAYRTDQAGDQEYSDWTSFVSVHYFSAQTDEEPTDTPSPTAANTLVPPTNTSVPPPSEFCVLVGPGAYWLFPTSRFLSGLISYYPSDTCDDFDVTQSSIGNDGYVYTSSGQAAAVNLCAAGHNDGSVFDVVQQAFNTDVWQCTPPAADTPVPSATNTPLPPTDTPAPTPTYTPVSLISQQQQAQPSNTPAPLGRPTNLTAVQVEKGITLSWDAPAGQVDGYEILRRRPWLGEDSLLILVADTGSSATTYTDATATDSTRYTYRVKAIRNGEKSKRSNYDRVDRLPPTNPPALAATNTTIPTSTPVPTDTPVPPTNTPVPPTDTPVPTDTPIPPTNTPVPTDTPVPPTNTPIPSNTPVPPTDTPIPTNTPVPPLGRPQNLTASVVTNGVTLNWDAPAGQVDGYEILRRRPWLGEDTLLILVADTGSSATTYTDTTATDSTRYTYRVKAIRNGEKSKRSNYDRVDR